MNPMQPNDLNAWNLAPNQQQYNQYSGYPGGVPGNQMLGQPPSGGYPGFQQPGIPLQTPVQPNPQLYPTPQAQPMPQTYPTQQGQSMPQAYPAPQFQQMPQTGPMPQPGFTQQSYPSMGPSYSTGATGTYPGQQPPPPQQQQPYGCPFAPGYQSQTQPPGIGFGTNPYAPMG